MATKKQTEEKKKLADDLRAQCGNVISFNKLAEYLGMAPKTARKFLEDVPSYQLGNKRCFLAVDVAAKIEGLRVS